MSDARRIDRRTLFDLFRRSDHPGASTTDATTGASFSLDGFYAARARSCGQAASLPRFALRDGLPCVETVPAHAEPLGPDEERDT